MAGYHRIKFEGGIGEGGKYSYNEPLPSVLVIQGLWHGRFVVHEYRQSPYNPHVYRLITKSRSADPGPSQARQSL